MSTFRIGFKTSSAADRLYVLKIHHCPDPIHLILIPPPILPDLNLRVFVLRSPGAELMSTYAVNVPRGVAVGSTEELKMANQEQFPKDNETLNLMAYLKGKGHPYPQLLTKISPVVPLLPWATKKGNNSNVIFVMRHMETYFGGGVKGSKTGLRKEGAAQNAQLKVLRQRYLNEIVKFELNTVRSEVMRKSAEYRRQSLEWNRDILDEVARLR